MPKKLTSEDKQQILQLYKQLEETTSTLATRYGVSNSTISRFLKTNLPEAEYESLIQQKRKYRYGGEETEVPEVSTTKISPVLSIPYIPSAPSKQVVSPILPAPPGLELGEPNIRRRSVVSPPALKPNNWQESILEDIPAIPARKTTDKVPAFLRQEAMAVGLDVEDLQVNLEEDAIDDWEDLDEDEEDIEDITLASDFPHMRGENVQVIPLSGQELPKVCYLVVDRASELIAKPLKDFSDLGQIPNTEYQQKTLPVFDHHKVAQRFSNRFQKVIKIPDGQMLHKTRFHLHAKGITRLLINGQVYSLV